MRAVFAVFMVILLPLFARAEPQIRSVSVESARGTDVLSLHADAPLNPRRTFTLTNPDRLVVDLPPTGGLAVTLPQNYPGNLIKALRFGRFDAETSRLVIDLARPATLAETVPGNPLLLTVQAAEAVSVNAPSRNAAGDVAIQPNNKNLIAASTPLPRSDEKTTAKIPAKPLIVIDAGHGGQDPGATGLHDTHEKIITLNYAKSLRTALVETGRYRVELTRDDDSYILLPERVAIARRAKADLFISIHADSNPRAQAQGLSIYTLSETASDDEAAALAERENKSDIISGIDLNTTDPDVANILIDLTQRETLNKSSNLADSIVRAMQKNRINTLESTHRFAGFRVLKAPDVPSVLIELGFLTNPEDERLLLSPDYRNRIINGIVEGIDHYRSEKFSR